MASFRSEKAVASYVTALYSRVQAALLSAPACVDASASQVLCGRSDSTVRERQLSATPALLEKRSSSLMPAEPRGASKVVSARSAEALMASVECRPPIPLVHLEPRTEKQQLATTQLPPAYEDDFKAVARLLLSSPEMLAAYHVAPDVDVDVSFSQIDA